MAKHSFFQVRKRTDTPGKPYSIVETLPGGRTRTVGTSDSRVKANMSAGIRDSERLIAQRGRKG